jgi:hypothetical protein
MPTWWPKKVLRGCKGKVKHPTLGKAQAAARALAKLEDRPVDEINSYFCCRCRGYHIGHDGLAPKASDAPTLHPEDPNPRTHPEGY